MSFCGKKWGTELNPLRDAIEIWGTCPKYKEYASKWLWYRLVAAYDNDKLHVYYDDDGKPIGFITYCFLTDEESKAYDYYGPETFKREGGDQLWFIDMVANGGRADVLRICKDMRRKISAKYPQVKTVLSFRHATRVGSWPNKGIWHDTHAA